MSKITIYSKPNCSQCNFTKRFLDDQKIAYQEIDVMQNDNALQHIKELGFLSLPVVEGPDFESFNGFNLMKLKQLVP